MPDQGKTTDPPATRSSLLQRDDPHRPEAGVRPEIVTNREEFSYRAPKVSGYHGSGLYWWPNGGHAANVHQASIVTAGNMRLVIRDANGTEVYSRSLADRGSFLTQNGATGRWTIQVVYDDAGGAVSFRVRRKH